MAMLEVGETVDDLREISLDPSSLEWGLQDISAGDAGRVQDDINTMYKMRTSQKRTLMFTWTLPTQEQTTEILRAFNPEYVFVRYYDPLDGDLNIREFYTGNKKAPFKWYNLPEKGTRFTTLSFDIIER